MDLRKKINKVKQRRARRTRSKIKGVAEKPRVSVFRSNKYTYVQIIDDKIGATILSLSTYNIKSKNNKTNKAFELGEMIGKKMLEQGIKTAVFDRGSYKYHGRVKAVAEGLRKSGIKI
ncbi:MAG: 50S ribosomal protein L18 [Minisyncoccia bacterium]